MCFSLSLFFQEQLRRQNRRCTETTLSKTILSARHSREREDRLDFHGRPRIRRPDARESTNAKKRLREARLLGQRIVKINIPLGGEFISLRGGKKKRNGKENQLSGSLEQTAASMNIRRAGNSIR